MKNSEEYVPRQVIEQQLLVALDDKSKVAIIADKELLDFLILSAAGCSQVLNVDHEYQFKVVEDLRQLRDAAFH